MSNLQRMIDLVRPGALERQIDGAISMVAHPGEHTDVASWRDTLAMLKKRAYKCMAYLDMQMRNGMTESVMRATQARRERYSAMVRDADSVLRGRKE